MVDTALLMLSCYLHARGQALVGGPGGVNNNQQREHAPARLALLLTRCYSDTGLAADQYRPINIYGLEPATKRGTGSDIKRRENGNYAYK